MSGVDVRHYSEAAVERTMRIQEVILQALAKKISWWQAAEIIGISDRQMRRWKRRYERYGYDGLYDRRRGKPSPRQVPLQTVERVLSLYREKYFDFNVRHFHEKLREEEGIQLSYMWAKLALQGAGRTIQAARGAEVQVFYRGPAAATPVSTLALSRACKAAWAARQGRSAWLVRDKCGSDRARSGRRDSRRCECYPG